MKHAVSVAVIAVLTCTVLPERGEAQSWPLTSRSTSSVQWMAGGYLPLSSLGAYGAYRVSMDPWASIGVSLRPGADDARFRPRFEVGVVPSVAMRRTPLETGEETVDAHTPDALRLTLLNSRFLVDVTGELASGSIVYLTGGASIRFQVSEPEDCPSTAGDECALPQFARMRLDPGMVLGLGWEPDGSWIQGVQLTGRMSVYGRAERPLAAPEIFLPELEMSVRFGR